MGQILNMHQFGVTAQHEINQQEVETLQRSFEAYRVHIIGQYALNHSDLVANVKAADANKAFVASTVNLFPALEEGAFRTDDELTLNTILATTYWDCDYSYISDPEYIIGKSETDILLARPSTMMSATGGYSTRKGNRPRKERPEYDPLQTQKLGRIDGRAARKRLIRNFDTIDDTDILSEQAKNTCFNETTLEYVVRDHERVDRVLRPHIFGAKKYKNKDPKAFTGRLHNTEMVKYGVVQRLAFMAVRFGKIVEFNEELGKLHNNLAAIYGSGDEIQQDVAAAIRLEK